MRSAVVAIAFTLTGFFVGAALFIATSLVLAWTSPTSAPPNGNVSAPINVGTVDQVKNAGLGINALAVFGNAIISTVSGYLNFGSTAGASGYGIRDNAGTMEFKNNESSWQSATNTIQRYFAAGSAYTVAQIKFADGTTQTTASSVCPSGFTAITAAGQRLGCMQTGEANSGTPLRWTAATQHCFQNYGGRLPFYAEWYSAMNNFTLTNETDDNEWLADFADEDGGTPGRFAEVGTGSITNGDTNPEANLHPFRCFLPNQ